MLISKIVEPRALGINNSIHIPNNESETKNFLLVSKRPGTYMPFDDVLAHIYFVTTAKDIIHLIIPKTVKKDKN